MIHVDWATGYALGRQGGKTWEIPRSRTFGIQDRMESEAVRSEFRFGPVRWEAWIYWRGAASKVVYRGFTVKLSDITSQGDAIFCRGRKE